MKTGNKSKRGLLIGCICILILAIVAVSVWYFQIKKPHDEAVTAYQNAVAYVEEKNSELDDAIDTAQEIIESGDQPLDESTLTETKEAVASADRAKRIIPEMPDETDAINSTAQKLNEELDYSAEIAEIEKCQEALDKSIQQYRQVTEPSEEFVINRLKKTKSVSDIAAVTEDHDPNGNLHKAGGYTASVYFSSPWINQDDVYGDDLIEKGTEAGGCVEVYATVEDAEKRNTYLSAFDGSIFDSGSHCVIGTVVVRTSHRLTATQQKKLEKRVIKSLTKLDS